MDIGSRNSYPAGKLSNFTAFEFEFDGVKCNSMEGLLQSFKFENIDAQKSTCLLTGFSAKKKGSGRNKYWKSKQTLWWNGFSYPRKSKEYQRLLDRAYNALYENENFRKALEAAGDKTIFTHSIGKSNRKETVLTESEFCKRLQYLKDNGEIPITNNDIEGEW
jgi:predicted NAD-dependent protein-ADP-ribosyltransferase YbiA (DUF1768 family)